MGRNSFYNVGAYNAENKEDKSVKEKMTKHTVCLSHSKVVPGHEHDNVQYVHVV